MYGQDRTDLSRLTHSGHSKRGAYHGHVNEQDAIMDLKG